MKKIKITKEQYDKLLINEIKGVKGGLDRVDKSFSRTTKGIDLNKNINEDILNSGLPEAIYNFVGNILTNDSQKGLDRFFIQHGITWGDIATYLTSVGILVGVGNGVYRVKNFFDKVFSKNKEKAQEEKLNDIKIKIEQEIDTIKNDPKAPWNQETTYDKKQRLQSKPESDWKATPKPFNPDRRKAGLSEDEPDDYSSLEQEKTRQSEPEIQRSKTKQVFKPVGIGKELAILNGPDDMYIFDYTNFDRNDFLNPEYELDIDDVADFVNDNIQNISKGEGVESFDRGDDLIKLDEDLKEKIRELYSKDKEFIEILNKLTEMTGASSSGSYTGLFGGAASTKKNISPDYSPAKQIDIINDEEEIYGGKKETQIKEMTATGGNPVSSPQGQYTQPAIWAKNEKNWAGNKKTQYPNGKMVHFDPCTKLNNNKKAQSGKCSQGAINNVVKTTKTKQSVISKSMYEAIAQKTGRTLEDVQRIIEVNINKSKSL